MRNEDYFEYIVKKSFEERLRAFGRACEDMVRNSFEGVRPGISNEDRQWYNNEYKAQVERAEFLFKNLIKDRGDITQTPMKIVEVNPEIKTLVDENDGYCPCLVQKNPDTKCMCKDFREQTTPGLCHCGRFEKVE